MGETADQIKSEIEQTRARLGQDLNDLEYRVKQETDWRLHVRRRPWPYLGAVFGASMMLGFAVSGKRR